MKRHFSMDFGQRLDVSDNLRLCNTEDIKLAAQIVELMVERNQNAWNKDAYQKE